MVKEGGGAVILRLTSAQYFSGMPTALSSDSFLCLISSSFLRLDGQRKRLIKSTVANSSNFAIQSSACDYGRLGGNLSNFNRKLDTVLCKLLVQ